MESTQAFDNQDFAIRQHLLRGVNCSVPFQRLSSILNRPFQPDRRTTIGTGYRLGMKTPVEWILVFNGAVQAHRKRRHCCVGTVIGDIGDDGKPRSAVGTVDERVTIAPVSRVKEFAQAIITDTNIRGDGLEVTLHRFRANNLKRVKQPRYPERNVKAVNTRQRREFGLQSMDK